MANSSSIHGVIVLDTAGGYAPTYGKWTIHGILFVSGGTAGSITIRETDADAGVIVALGSVSATSGSTEYLPMPPSRGFAGLYIRTGQFPANSYAVIYLK
ncbi:MAG: hypothetical protein ABIH23_08550 [bacterium]